MKTNFTRISGVCGNVARQILVTVRRRTVLISSFVFDENFVKISFFENSVSKLRNCLEHDYTFFCSKHTVQEESNMAEKGVPNYVQTMTMMNSIFFLKCYCSRHVALLRVLRNHLQLINSHLQTTSQTRFRATSCISIIFQPKDILRFHVRTTFSQSRFEVINTAGSLHFYNKLKESG